MCSKRGTPFEWRDIGNIPEILKGTPESPVLNYTNPAATKVFSSPVTTHTCTAVERPFFISISFTTLLPFILIRVRDVSKEIRNEQNFCFFKRTKEGKAVHQWLKPNLVHRNYSLRVVPCKTHTNVHVHAYVCACEWYFFLDNKLRVKYVKSTRNTVKFTP